MYSEHQIQHSQHKVLKTSLYLILFFNTISLHVQTITSFIKIKSLHFNQLDKKGWTANGIYHIIPLN